MSRPDPLTLPPVVQPEYGATVLERLLLAIINAHTTPETDGCQRGRLSVATTALIGPAQGGYRPRPPEDAYFADILEAEALQRLCAELAEWDVPTRFEAEPRTNESSSCRRSVGPAVRAPSDALKR